MAQCAFANCATACKKSSILCWSFNTRNWIRQICRESFLTGADWINFSSLLGTCNSLLRKDKICTCTKSYRRDMEKLKLLSVQPTRPRDKSKFQPTGQRFTWENPKHLSTCFTELNILVSKSKIVLSLIVMLFQPCVRAYIAELCIFYLFCLRMRNM